MSCSCSFFRALRISNFVFHYRSLIGTWLVPLKPLFKIIRFALKESDIGRSCVDNSKKESPTVMVFVLFQLIFPLNCYFYYIGN